MTNQLSAENQNKFLNTTNVKEKKMENKKQLKKKKKEKKKGKKSRN